MNQGKYNPNIVKAILVASRIEKKSQREIAASLNINYKTVNRHLALAEKSGISIEDLNLSAQELCSKIQIRYKVDTAILQRTSTIKTIHHITKKHLSECFSSDNFCYSDCYKLYLSEHPKKIHFCKSYYISQLKKYLKKEILKASFFKLPWTKEDVITLSSFIGPKFTSYMQQICYSHIGVRVCMRILCFINGNRFIYGVAEKLVLSNPCISYFSLRFFWKELLKCKDTCTNSSWDYRYFQYLENKKNNYKEAMFKKYGL